MHVQRTHVQLCSCQPRSEGYAHHHQKDFQALQAHLALPCWLWAAAPAAQASAQLALLSSRIELAHLRAGRRQVPPLREPDYADEAFLHAHVEVARLQQAADLAEGGEAGRAERPSGAAKEAAAEAAAEADSDAEDKCALPLLACSEHEVGPVRPHLHMSLKAFPHAAPAHADMGSPPQRCMAIACQSMLGAAAAAP